MNGEFVSTVAIDESLEILPEEASRLMATENQESDRPVLYFDDLRVGQQVVSGMHRLDEAQIVAFSRQFDPQPFHTDRDGAKDSLFGELVASGWHTAAITMRLMVDSGLPIAGGHIGVGVEIAWPRPTRPGAELHVESEIIELTPSRSRPDRGMATVRNKTLDHTGEIVQIMTAKMIVPRRPQPTPPQSPL